MGYAVLELEKLVENEDTGDSGTKEVTNRGEIVEGKSRERAVAREEGSKAGPWRNCFLASGASGSWRGRGEETAGVGTSPQRLVGQEERGRSNPAC